MSPSQDELAILHAILRSYHPKARAKPRNFIRTHDEVANLAVFDGMVEKDWLVKENMPGHCYRATSAGKLIYKEFRA